MPYEKLHKPVDTTGFPADLIRRRPENDPQALKLYQGVIDQISAAVLDGNVEAFLPLFTLPHHMKSENGKLTLETSDELRAHFESFSGSLLAQGMTDYVRIAHWATFDGDKRIVGEHKTHMMRGANRLAPPYPNLVVLDFEADAWRASYAVSALSNTSWPIYSVKVAQNPVLPGLDEFSNDELGHAPNKLL